MHGLHGEVYEGEIGTKHNIIGLVSDNVWTKALLIQPIARQVVFMLLHNSHSRPPTRNLNLLQEDDDL